MGDGGDAAEVAEEVEGGASAERIGPRRAAEGVASYGAGFESLAVGGRRLDLDRRVESQRRRPPPPGRRSGRRRGRRSRASGDEVRRHHGVGGEVAGPSQVLGEGGDERSDS